MGLCAAFVDLTPNGSSMIYSSLPLADSLVLSDSKPNTRVYAVRWWILAVYSAFAFQQGFQWGLPGGLTDVYSAQYNVDGGGIQLMLNWGPIWYLVTALPFALWIDRPNGLRQSVMFSLLLAAVGVALRCFATASDDMSLYLLNGGYILNAIAGPVAMSAVSRLSEDWFAVSERGLATAIAAEANLLGAAVAYVIGPYAVPGDSTMASVQLYNYIGAAAMGLNLLACIIYFPSRPPLPPSLSASTHAPSAPFTISQFYNAIRVMATNRDFVILCITYGLTCGMASGWGSTMSLNLASLSYSASDAGWIAFGSVIGGVVGGLIFGRVVDRFRSHKFVVVAALACSCILLIYFALLLQGGVLPASWTTGSAGLTQLFFVATAAGFTLNSIVPIYFELAIEATFPLPEGTVITLMTMVNNGGTLILLFVPLDRAANIFNWAFAATTIILTLLLASLFRERAKRFKIDNGMIRGGDEVLDDADSDNESVMTESMQDVLLRGREDFSLNK